MNFGTNTYRRPTSGKLIPGSIAQNEKLDAAARAAADELDADDPLAISPSAREAKRRIVAEVIRKHFPADLFW